MSDILKCYKCGFECTSEKIYFVHLEECNTEDESKEEKPKKAVK